MQADAAVPTLSAVVLLPPVRADGGTAATLFARALLPPVQADDTAATVIQNVCTCSFASESRAAHCARPFPWVSEFFVCFRPFPMPPKIVSVRLPPPLRRASARALLFAQPLGAGEDCRTYSICCGLREDMQMEGPLWHAHEPRPASFRPPTRWQLSIGAQTAVVCRCSHRDLLRVVRAV